MGIPADVRRAEALATSLRIRGREVASLSGGERLGRAGRLLGIPNCCCSTSRRRISISPIKSARSTSWRDSRDRGKSVLVLHDLHPRCATPITPLRWVILRERRRGRHDPRRARIVGALRPSVAGAGRGPRADVCASLDVRRREAQRTFDSVRFCVPAPTCTPLIGSLFGSETPAMAKASPTVTNRYRADRSAATPSKANPKS